MSKRAKESQGRTNGATLVDLRINRRLSRGNDWEIWIIDGLTAEGEEICGAGDLAITQDANGEFVHVIGGIRHKHNLQTKGDVADLLLKRLEELDYLKGLIFFNWKDGSIDMDWEL